MARFALAAASIALLSLSALTAAHAQVGATIVIQSGAPTTSAPPRRWCNTRPHRPRATKQCPATGAAWHGCPATGNGAATAMCGCKATG